MIYLIRSSNKKDGKLLSVLYIGSKSVEHAIKSAKFYFKKNNLKGKPIVFMERS